MTTTTHWADRYLQRKLNATSSDYEEAATLGYEPEASEYMDGLSTFDLSHLSRERRLEYLEATVRALVEAMESGNGVADRHCGIRRAVAYSDDEPIVGLIDGFGEVVSLDRETAALLAFAYHLEPEPSDADTDD
ncbi:hypothetical protein [Natrinema salsiterrestre]|uniref:Uncharacterized protein n=1 Tax=Natrinema salsiterrestre TaxID=2950540 RepID=A0A9Q4KZ51_9EURY|nr:hypothetical protein [Natrinema salsiterrestre]MDF9744369.1 hypothetical protein [Natrinema salsiterrestre]